VDSFVVNVENFTITVKDEKGCSTSAPFAIPLNHAVFVDLGNDTTICEGNSVQFNTTSYANTFAWNTDPSLSNTFIANPVASPVSTTTYYITAVKDICTARDTITVTVLPAPVANAGPDSSICVGKTINLTGSGGSSYSWLPAGQFLNPNDANPSIKPMQSGSYYLQVFSAAGCPSLRLDTVNITTVPAVQAFAGRDTSVAVGQPLQLIGRELGNSGVNVFEWSPSFGLTDPNIYNPVATLDRDQIYKLTLTTPEGCEGTDYISIKVFTSPEIYVATGFTPNGDGLNDELKPVPVGMKELKFFRVFNRWGQMVFSTNTDSRGWDGRINGMKQATGTFVWVAEAVDFNGNVITRKGVTTLIR
jgi:gliding motility-associated-like protein